MVVRSSCTLRTVSPSREKSESIIQGDSNKGGSTGRCGGGHSATGLANGAPVSGARIGHDLWAVLLSTVILAAAGTLSRCAAHGVSSWALGWKLGGLSSDTVILDAGDNYSPEALSIASEGNCARLKEIL